jgi:hypothetical protein
VNCSSLSLVAKVVALTTPKRRARNATLHPTGQHYVPCNYHEDARYLLILVRKWPHQLDRSRMYALEHVPSDSSELRTRTLLKPIILPLFNSYLCEQLSRIEGATWPA